jgi:hypothetical protein
VGSHVTGASVHVTPFGRLQSFITLTDDGKPLPPTDEPEHVLTGFCWCQPLVETDPVTGDHLFIHRRSIDSPHIEQAD